MSRVFFFMQFREPDRASLLGGPQVVVQHAEILTSHGVNARIVHQGGRSWRRHADPLFIPERAFRKELDPESDLVVFPGRMAVEHRKVPGLRKVLLMQNMATNLGDISPDYRGTYPWHDDSVKGVICVSEHNAGLIRLALPSCPVLVTHNRVDAERFSYRALAQKEPLVLLNSLGRDEKNPRHTKMLVHLLRSRSSAGMGPLGDHEFQVLGGVSPERMPDLLGRTKLLFFLSADEGLALLPLEAMASGAIVLGYDIGPMNEYLPAECLRPWGDLRGLVDLAESVTNPSNASYWSEVSRKARSTAERYSAARQTLSVMTAYRALLGQ